MNYNYSDLHYPSPSPSLSPSPPPPQPLLALPPPPPPPPQPPPATDFLASGLTQKQRKKRSKLVPVDDSSSSGTLQKRKYTKPDPAAPKITAPCTECGKTFWSWKALFGHMRCHPERHWRGINPPPNAARPLELAVRHVPEGLDQSVSGSGVVEMTEEDHEVAACLLLLANGVHENLLPDAEQCAYESSIVVRDTDNAANYKFECSCCKKVFNSHQALGGHRASHKNVKGCFANTRAEGDEEAGRELAECSGTAGCSSDAMPSSSMALVIRHSCSICAKVFSTGQALGGHMRCHWEKSDDTQFAPVTPQAPASTSRRALDLNIPAPLDHDPSSGYSSSLGLRLDLRLGL